MKKPLSVKILDPVLHASNIIDTELKRLADIEYRKQYEAWERKIVKAELENVEALNTPGYSESLGLPSELPDFTISILKRTMALDKHGDDMPNRSVVYRRFGIFNE